MKLLFVENEILVPEELKSILKKEECNFELLSLDKASSKFNNSEFDCIVIFTKHTSSQLLDLISDLNTENRTDGIILVSDLKETDFIIKCFELGVDDFYEYSTPPLILKAKINAVVRRKRYNAKSKLYFANLVIDFYLKQVFVWDKKINLTKKEYDILLYLIANKESSVTKESIAEYVWGDYLKKIDSYDFLFAHIKNLKNKLKAAKGELVIKNTYGIGYQIEEI
ncbi:MAG TPA: winged helix-turn-helix domain-containing protein [Bacteroidia bacterium]|nr:response regulator transcription factor [Bacteroidia bacterium]HSH64473.1 winged helix-turn-helix domain-containing protein [Bacteroidia bacterium]